jgi:nicotinate-nucleotide adenylyltransferase
VKLGFLGGSFDPIHVGHLLMAQRALEALRLDRVLLVVSPRPPHKRPAELAPARHRLAMARAAVRGLERIGVSDVEFRMRGPSYTVRTAEALRRRHPGATLTLLIGQDTLGEIRGWREAPRLLSQVRVAVYRRSGSRAPDGRVRWIDGPALDVSSREIRRRVRRGRPIAFWVPVPVQRYIQQHRLYRRPGRRKG